ncbi:MAG: protein phosphatase 2C domain-containing protein [Ilumatobacteraceae bacterium]
MITVAFAAATHAGNRRTLNEDSFCAMSPVFMVADGMGGHASGEVASALATGAVGSMAATDGVDPSHVRETVREANRIIHQRSAGATRGMGTTLTGLVVAKWTTPHLAVVNVGDSRTYCWSSERGLQQITVDHSQVQELIDSGAITVEEAATHPERNVVTRALGIDPDVDVDVFLVPAAVGQRWLACSDGLTGELSTDQIAALLAEGDVSTAAAALVDATVAGPARDNVTVVVVDVVDIEMLEDLDRTDPRGALDITAPNPRLRPAADLPAPPPPPAAGDLAVIDDVPLSAAPLPPPTVAPTVIDGVPDALDVVAPSPNDPRGE